MKQQLRHPACEVCCDCRTCPLGWITESICTLMDARPWKAVEGPTTYGLPVWAAQPWTEPNEPEMKVYERPEPTEPEQPPLFEDAWLTY